MKKLNDYLYYHTDLGKLYCGSALDILPLIEEQIDLTLTDFPYGINFEYDNYVDTPENLQNLIDNITPVIFGISKRSLITCGVTNIFRYPEPKWILCWYYGTTNVNGQWGFNGWQPILAYGDDPYLKAGKGRRLDVIKDAHFPEKSEHPCPKSLTFWKKLLIRGSFDNNDLILDPFAGSGTTGMACEQLNRKWICIESSEKYCEIASKRIMLEANQTKLF